ncbi:hypothetical protein GCM10023080_040360 [Streptomyces pseudoechinosporeus]
MAAGLAALPLVPLPGGVAAVCVVSAGQALVTRALRVCSPEARPRTDGGADGGSACVHGPACAGVLYDYGPAPAYLAAERAVCAAGVMASRIPRRASAVGNT